MNWDDPAARLALIEAVGIDEYNRRFTAHREASVVATANGHPIRPVQTRFGRLFAVGKEGNRAFSTLAEAVAHANTLPAGT